MAYRYPSIQASEGGCGSSNSRPCTPQRPHAQYAEYLGTGPNFNAYVMSFPFLNKLVSTPGIIATNVPLSPSSPSNSATETNFTLPVGRTYLITVTLPIDNYASGSAVIYKLNYKSSSLRTTYGQGTPYPGATGYSNCDVNTVDSTQPLITLFQSVAGAETVYVGITSANDTPILDLGNCKIIIVQLN